MKFRLFFVSFFCIAVLGVCFCGQVCFVWADADLTSAKSMVIIEISQNKVLFQKDKDIKLPMASTTKIVTALTVLNNCIDIEQMITIDKQSTLTEGTSIYLKEGEKLTVRQLLYGLMLQSGNDAASALALHFGGSMQGFAELMNKTATDLGLKNSNFVNSHGLDSNEHFTTAFDLACLTSAALKNPTFKEIVSSKNFLIEETEFNTRRYLINKNKLLTSLDGCVGVKTGFTKKAGRCLVSACERDGMQLVCVVLNCGPMFEESAKLLNLAFEQYINYEVLKPYTYISDVIVENGESNKVKVYNKEGFSLVVKKQEVANIRVENQLPTIISAPVKKDEEIGKIKIYLNNDLLFISKAYSIESVDGLKTTDKLKNILDKW